MIRSLILYFIAAICLAGSANGQDTLVLRKGETILAKVLEVDITEIKYSRTDNPGGPVYAVAKTDILTIKYENGKIEEPFKMAQQSRSRDSALLASNYWKQKAKGRFVAGTALMSVGTTALVAGGVFMAMGFSASADRPNPMGQVLGIMFAGVGVATNITGGIVLSRGLKYNRLANELKASISFNPLIRDSNLDRYNFGMNRNKLGTLSVTF